MERIIIINCIINEIIETVQMEWHQYIDEVHYDDDEIIAEICEDAVEFVPSLYSVELNEIEKWYIWSMI